jgi:hypothetical protein
VLDAGYASFWTRYLDTASSKALDTLRTALDDFVAKTAAGDSSAWDAGQLTAMDNAKSYFKNVLSREYLGAESASAQKSFDAEVESPAKTRQALWAKHDSEVLDELNRKLKKQQFAYSTRLADSLLPERQPPAYDAIVNPQSERVSTARLSDVYLSADEQFPRMSSRSSSPSTRSDDGPVKIRSISLTHLCKATRETSSRNGTAVSRLCFILPPSSAL